MTNYRDDLMNFSFNQTRNPVPDDRRMRISEIESGSGKPEAGCLKTKHQAIIGENNQGEYGPFCISK